MKYKLIDVIARIKDKEVVNQIKGKKEYAMYLHGTPFILRFMDKMGMEYDKPKVEEKLYYFWIFLKAVDLEMEKDKKTGKEVFGVLCGKKSNKKRFDIIMAKKLNKYMETSTIKKEFYRLYKNVIKEKEAANVLDLIMLRKKNGDQAADIIYELIKDDIERKNKKFTYFLHESMKIQQIMDSYVDLEEDYKKGELNFKPTFKDKNKLRKELLKGTLKNTLKYPLTGILLLAGISYLKKMQK